MNHSKKGNIFVLVMFLVITLIADVHAEDTHGLELLDYYQGALKTSPDFVKSEAETKIEKDSLSRNYQEYLPTISLSYDNSYIESEGSGAASAYTSQGDYRKKALSGSIAQPLFDKKKISRTFYNQTKIGTIDSELELKKQNLLKEVFNLYQEFYLLQAEIDLAQHVDTSAKEALGRIHSAVQQGVGREVDFYLAKTTALRTSSELRRYRSRFQDLATKFKVLTGFSDMPNAAICTGDYKFSAEISNEDLFKYETASPELDYLQTSLQLVKAERDVANSELYPTVYLSYEKSRSSTIHGTFDGSIEDQSVTSVGVKIPILTGNGSYQRAKVAAQTEAVYEATIFRKKIDHIRLMRSLISRYLEMNKGYLELLEAYRFSSTLLKVKQQEFELGRISAEDFDSVVKDYLELRVEQGRYCMEKLEIRVLLAEETGRIDYLVME